MPDSHDRFVLGFDAACVKCSNLAGDLEQIVGDRLDVVPLTSPDMRRWRREALGADAPWAPTLVRVRTDSVDAWPGWRMGPVLTRHLGSRGTMRVLTLLGDKLGGMPKRTAGKSRRTFMRASLGAVAGIGLLTGTRLPAAAGTDGRRPTVPDEAISELDGDALLDTAMRHLQGEDARNIVEPRSLGRVARTGATVADVPRSALRVATDTTGDAPADGSLEVAGRVIDHPQGVRETTLFLYQHEERTLLISTEYSEPVGGETTHVHRLHVEHEDRQNGPVLRTVARSVNGAVPRPAPEAPEPTAACDDPCGGCNSSLCSCGMRGEHLSRMCNWELTTDCVMSLHGCAGCGTKCKPGPWGWFNCAVCVVHSCWGAVVACCPEATPVCLRCRPCQT